MSEILYPIQTTDFKTCQNIKTKVILEVLLV
jgi:hypothetical protein